MGESGVWQDLREVVSPFLPYMLRPKALVTVISHRGLLSGALNKPRPAVRRICPMRIPLWPCT